MFRSPLSRARRLVAFAFVLSTLAAAFAAPIASAASPLTTFQFQMDTNCVSGTSVPDSELIVRLRSSAGMYQGHVKTTTDTYGNWRGCFLADINAGDVLEATDGTNSRTYPVQPLSYTVNRVTNVLSGRATPKSTVQLFVMNCQATWSSCDEPVSQVQPTNRNGAFSYNFTNAYDIRGGDYTHVHLISAGGDDQWARRYTPYLIAWAGNNYSWGLASPNKQFNAWLFDSHGNQKAKTAARGDVWTGYFVATFRNKGRAVDVALNDYVVSNLASDATIKVIDFHPVMNVDTDDISGKCFKNVSFHIQANHLDETTFGASGVTDADGNFAVNSMTAASFDLQTADWVDISCRTPQGDLLEQTFEVGAS